MRAVVQRVRTAKVSVEEKVVGEIGSGLLVFLAVGCEDCDQDLNYMVEKIAGLRIFEDEDEKMNRSVLDVGGEMLVISQFTLYGDVRKGKRPSFMRSERPEKAKAGVDRFIDQVRHLGIDVATGVFGADMAIHAVHDGPVTIQIDSKKEY